MDEKTRNKIVAAGLITTVALAVLGWTAISVAIINHVPSLNEYVYGYFPFFLMADFMAFVLFNIILFLVRFTLVITEKEEKYASMKTYNIAFLVIAFLICFVWFLETMGCRILE